MDSQRPSRTAEGAAALRVWHGLVDDPPHLIDDSAVRALLRMSTRAVLQQPPRWLRLAIRTQERFQPELAALRGQVVVRGRFAEDALDAALAQGCRQVIILGAGLDTTALRRPELLESVALFEVDHPATQAWKRNRLAAEVADKIRFVAVDFERDDLALALLEAGVRTDQPLFVNWLGCTYYLNPDAQNAALGAVGRVAAPGSQLVLDYWLPGAALPLRPRLLLAGVRFAVALQREPLLGLQDSAQLAARATTAGWTIAEDLDAEDQRARWIRGRRDTLAVPEFAQLARLKLG